MTHGSARRAATARRGPHMRAGARTHPYLATAATAVVGVAALTVLGLAPPAVAGTPADGTALLERAAEAAGATPHRGQILWVTWDDGVSHVQMVDVEQDRRDLTVRTPGQTTVELSVAGGGALAHHRQGWFVPLPRPRGAAEGPARELEEKYTVEVRGTERLLDRPASRVEVRRRDDGLLRERLWVDEETGLLLRRETLHGDDLLRMAVYVSLDLTRPAPEAAAPATPDAVPLRARDQGVQTVRPRGLDALRRAGWIVPESLPGGYEADGGFALSSGDSQPLQLVYDDGLYTVSLFAQPGAPDLGSLPDGAVPARWRGIPEGSAAYEWPGAVPQRLVWGADGTTYSLIGDAPPDEFRAIAAALPHDQPVGGWKRVGSGLSRLWSWVSPWG